MEIQQLDFKVRPVTRYIVTRYEVKGNGTNHGSVGSITLGEFDNLNVAYEVGYALAKAEHDRLGWPPGDMRIKYPEPLRQSHVGETSI